MGVESAPQETWPITGVVVEVPQRLLFMKKKGPMMKYRNSASSEFDTDIGIGVGDVVAFAFTAWYQYDYDNYAGDLIVPYHDLHLNISTGKALNGYLLVEVDENPVEVVGPATFLKADANVYGIGRVVYRGPCNRAYLYYPGADADGVGDYVFYRGGARLELDAFNTMTDRQSSLFLIQRKDVLLWSTIPFAKAI